MFNNPDPLQGLVAGVENNDITKHSLGADVLIITVFVFQTGQI